MLYCHFDFHNIKANLRYQLKPRSIQLKRLKENDYFQVEN